MDKQVPAPSKRLAPASCVRFADDEYQQIEEDSAHTGKSIPTLLKERYFSGPRPLPLFGKAELDHVLAQLGRIGNNVNQIAWRLNSGVRAGIASEFEEIQRLFRELLAFLASEHARRSNAAKA